MVLNAAERSRKKRLGATCLPSEHAFGSALCCGLGSLQLFCCAILGNSKKELATPFGHRSKTCHSVQLSFNSEADIFISICPSLQSILGSVQAMQGRWLLTYWPLTSNNHKYYFGVPLLDRGKVLFPCIVCFPNNIIFLSSCHVLEKFSPSLLFSSLVQLSNTSTWSQRPYSNHVVIFLLISSRWD